MAARKPGRGARDWLGGVLAAWSNRLLYGDGHDIIIRDPNGRAICVISAPGGYVATGPAAPYTFECCGWNADQDDENPVVAAALAQTHEPGPAQEGTVG
ncbi:hypothetical protein [Mycobacterium asiaticum]|uniref:Uncharacterized protein n=1 Tax=Mycobacterium asiaticum TaxID=1790 RepID=A0A1A3NN55_MYCAS|nr:hypothetical protein [Mycobacterium asiaticum]OBK22509.1 hypothetical protein A5635_21570 [Mycobacterium asiaticum]